VFGAPFFLYAAALWLQIIAALLAIGLYRKSDRYRIGWFFLSLGLALMAGRLLPPLMSNPEMTMNTLLDAGLAMLVSVVLFSGLVGIRQIVTVLKNHNHELEKILATDSLTGALSRSEMLNRTRQEISRSLRTGHALTFVVMDIDHFKAVNDRHGHEFGDFVLRELSGCCMQQLRKIDLFGRVGGEEFMIVLPDTNAVQAREVCERVRIAAEKKEYTSEAGQLIHVTISLGIATLEPARFQLTQEPKLLRTFFQLADSAMYQAKQAGRNRSISSLQ